MPAMNKQHRAAGRPRNTPYRRIGAANPAEFTVVAQEQNNRFGARRYLSVIATPGHQCVVVETVRAENRIHGL